MITNTVDLYEYYKAERNGAGGGYLTVYARERYSEVKERIRPAMLIFPGGGYQYVSERESEPVAIKYLEKGYAAFVLNYSVHTKYPTPLYEAEMAIAYIRDRAEDYGVDLNHIAAIGFSAGGHLAGLLATAKQREAFFKTDIRKLKPNAVILSYAVSTMGEYTGLNTRKTITGNDNSIYDILAIEKRVDENTVPAFVWHTLEDKVVPIENAFLLTKAYRQNNIPFALHIFEHGGHGLSVANDEVCSFSESERYLYRVGKWFDLSLDWLEAKGFGVTVKS